MEFLNLRPNEATNKIMFRTLRVFDRTYNPVEYNYDYNAMKSVFNIFGSNGENHGDWE